jgi:hypothetical protein
MTVLAIALLAPAASLGLLLALARLEEAVLQPGESPRERPP